MIGWVAAVVAEEPLRRVDGGRRCERTVRARQRNLALATNRHGAVKTARESQIEQKTLLRVLDTRRMSSEQFRRVERLAGDEMGSLLARAGITVLD